MHSALAGWRPEMTDHAHVELALDEPDDAGGFRGVDAERLRHQRASTAHEVITDLRDPARCGGAVNAEDRSDLVDREAVDQLVTQERAITRGQLGERGAKGLGKLGAVLRLQLLKGGVVAVAWIRDQVLFERFRPLLRLRDPDQLARDADPQPAAQRATACVVADRRRPTVARREQLRPDDGLVKTHPRDVLAIADQKGRLLFDTANTELWGGKVTSVGAIASAYASATETYLGVLDAADPTVVASGVLGGLPEQKLYVAFARGKRIGARPNAMFMQLVEADRLLEEVGVGENTMLSVVTAEGVAAGHVPESVLLHVDEGGIDELSLDDGNWLAELTPLRAAGQDTAIAQLVLARRTNVGLSGLFPHAQQTLGAFAAIFLALALGGFLVARQRDLNRRGVKAS